MLPACKTGHAAALFKLLLPALLDLLSPQNSGTTIALGPLTLLYGF